MNHLDIIQNPIRPPIKVPFVCTAEYDGQEWATYPLRRGWNQSILVQGLDFSEKSASETESMLQAWLYFGVLHEVLDLKAAELKTFVRRENAGLEVLSRLYKRLSILRREPSRLDVNDEPNSVIDSRRLPMYVTGWVLRVLKSTPEESTRHKEKMQKCLNEAIGFMSHSWSAQLEGRWPLRPAITTSILVLLETLICSLAIPIRITHSDSLLRLRFTNPPWCINQVHRIEQLGISATYIASSLRKPDNGKNHMALGCSAQKCLAYNIDETNYVTRHTTDECNCSFLAPNMEEVGRILERGKIPLIAIGSKSEDLRKPEWEITIVEAEPNVPFLAVSHVWSDGLGNPKQNSLPQCQVIDLMFKTGAVLRNYPPAGPNRYGTDGVMPFFWIDTLCVPLDPAWRKLAIRGMADVYHTARAVLVLDSSLRTMSVKETLEIRLIALITSGWMHRVWTYQEAILAQELIIVMNDGYFELFDIMNNAEAYRLPSPASFHMLFNTMALFGPLFLQADKVHRFKLIWNALQSRSTSKQRDEVIVFSTLMGLDLTDKLIDNDDQEEQIITFFSQLTKIPRDLLFCHAGPRLAQEGFGWAPASLRGLAGGVNEIESPAPAKRTSEGVLFDSFGFCFTPKAVLRNPFQLRVTGLPVLFNVMTADKIPWSSIGPRPGSRYAIVFSKSIPELGSMTTGFLVQWRKEVDSVNYVNFRCNVYIEAAPDSPKYEVIEVDLGHTSMEEAMLAARTRDKEAAWLRWEEIRKLPPEQRSVLAEDKEQEMTWCVG